MDRSTVKIFCEIAKNISLAKGIVASHCLNKQDKEYIEVRKLLDDCLELMAIKADVAPIRLITADVLNDAEMVHYIYEPAGEK